LRKRIYHELAAGQEKPDFQELGFDLRESNLPVICIGIRRKLVCFPGAQVETVSTMAHLTAPASVKGPIEEDPLVRAAFETMVTTGISAHHAEHILGAMRDGLVREWIGAKLELH
jgi:hypothetical protein